MSGAGLKELTDNLLSFAGSHGKLDPHELVTPENWARVKKNLQKGIRKAALKLLEEFSDKYQFRMMVEENLNPEKSEIDGQELANLFEYMQTTTTTKYKIK